MPTIIYDMDGLIIDSEPFWKIAEIKIFAELGVELTESDCAQTAGFRIDEVVEYWYKRSPWANPDHIATVKLIIDKMEQLIREEADALAGVHESLEFFKAKEFAMAVASSSPYQLINATVEKLKISDYYSILHSAQDEEKGKPHPATFLSCAKRLDVNPKDCLVFEDSAAGVEAALRAEMKVIAIPNASPADHPKFKEAHLVVGSLLEAIENWDAIRKQLDL